MKHAGLFAILLPFAAALAFLPLVRPVDEKILDLQFRFLRAFAQKPVQHEVAIVGIDDESARRIPEPLTLWHPYLGRFLQAVAASGAAAVGLDVVLPDRSFDSIVPGHDRELLRGILVARGALPLVLALTIDPAGAPRPVYERYVFAAGGWDATGYALLPVDGDGTVRRFDEALGANGSRVRTLAGTLAAKLGRPVGPGLIDFAAGRDFDYVPLHDVLAWQEAGDTERLRQAFAGKVVLLGGVFRFEDRLAAPVNLVAWEPQAANLPGVVLHAQALRTLLNGGAIARVPAWVVPVLALAAAACYWFAANFAVAAAVALVPAALLVVVSTWLLARGVHLPVAAVLFALALSVGARVLYEALRQLRERRRLRQAFGAYVSPDIMRDILKSDPPPGLGGERYSLCVLFADIRGFTERSERSTPEATIRLLNRYFDEFTTCIHARGGTLDKFIGDGVMAFFGAPQQLDNPCLPAVEAARVMLQRLPRLNAALELDGEPPIAIGIGIDAGDAVVGNMGSETRHNYTAIGDVVNVASRLEGLTKDTGYPLVCSERVWQRLDDRTGFVKLGPTAIKGHQPVVLYGWRPATPSLSDPMTEAR